MKEYDVIVIGGGGGTKIVSPAARLGYRVAVIEKEDLGGTCLNRGCIPSKMLIHPADLVEGLKRSSQFELGLDYSLNIDFASLITRVTDTVVAESKSIEPAYEKNPNITFYPHAARFVDNYTVEVDGEKLRAERIFIATGSRPTIPMIEGLEGTPYMTSREALRNTKLPKRLGVIGGGYIAVELGHVYGALGSEVHFMVRSEMIRAEDKDVRLEFTKEFSKKHKIHYTSPRKVSHNGELFIVECVDSTGNESSIECEELLVAAGVVPNTDSLGLESTDITCRPDGYIETNGQLMTKVPHVYALGDCVGNYLFRHSVNYEGEYLMRVVFEEGSDEEIVYPPIPHAVFTEPQIAGVGKTEDQLEAEGVDYVVGLNPYQKSAMGMARLSDHGFVKVLADPQTKKVLGAHTIGDEASNMVHLFILAMTVGATIDDLLEMVYIHPALPEIARNACRKARAEIEKHSAQ